MKDKVMQLSVRCDHKLGKGALGSQYAGKANTGGCLRGTGRGGGEGDGEDGVPLSGRLMRGRGIYVHIQRAFRNNNKINKLVRAMCSRVIYRPTRGSLSECWPPLRSPVPPSPPSISWTTLLNSLFPFIPSPVNAKQILMTVIPPISSALNLPLRFTNSLPIRQNYRRLSRFKPTPPHFIGPRRMALPRTTHHSNPPRHLHPPQHLPSSQTVPHEQSALV